MTEKKKQTVDDLLDMAIEIVNEDQFEAMIICRDSTKQVAFVLADDLGKEKFRNLVLWIQNSHRYHGKKDLN